MNKSISKFVIIYILSYCLFSFIMSNLTPFLNHLGYSQLQRGLILSSYAITTIFIQLVLGLLSDHLQTIKKIIMISMLLFVLLSIIILNQVSQHFIYHILIISFLVGLLNTCCGLYDTWILNSNNDTAIHLPFIKAFGSIGWAIGSIVSAKIVMEYGYSYLSYVYGLLIIIIGYLIYQIEDITKIAKRDKITKNDIKLLLVDKEYLLLVFILFLLYCLVIANNSIVVEKIIKLGASNTKLSLKWSIQSIVEIPTFLFGYLLLQKINHYLLLLISGVTLFIQFMLVGTTNNVDIIIYSSALQIFTTPLIMITSKILIFNIGTTTLKSTPQLLALSIFTGVSALLIPALSSIGSEVIGINNTITLLSLIALLAIGLLPKLIKYHKLNKQKITY